MRNPTSTTTCDTYRVNGLRNITTATVTAAALILGVPSLAGAAECPEDPTHYTTPTADGVVNEVARLGHSMRDACMKQAEDAAASVAALETLTDAVRDAGENVTNAVENNSGPSPSMVTREDAWSIAGLLLGLAAACWIATTVQRATE